MFNLNKDLDRYKGIPPYDSQLYGVYQPLMGWRSKLTSEWVRRNGPLLPDLRIKRILDSHISPGPTKVDEMRDWGFVQPMEAGSGRRPWTAVLRKDIGPSNLVQRVRERVQVFADSNDGRLPQGTDEWLTVLRADDVIGETYPDGSRTMLAEVNDYHRDRLLRKNMSIATVRHEFLSAMQFESQIASLLLWCVEGKAGLKPEMLEQLFGVEAAPPLADVFGSGDPLADIDPLDDGGTLAPVGIVHIYRQLYHDLGTFLGEPVEHVWLAPGTTTELIEVSTRRELVERTLEEALERTAKSERASTTTDELSTALKDQTESSLSVGISQSNTVDLHVYQGTLSADVGIASSRANSREQVQKTLRETSEKVTSELKQSIKSVFRTVTETTDTTSRRHVVSNPGDELLNYELRRKMRRVGVQLQDIGTRLCWQTFVDNPGDSLGLSELVHLTDTAELTNLKEPAKIQPPTSITKRMTVDLMYKPVLGYNNTKSRYEWDESKEYEPGKFIQLGQIRGDPDDDDSQIVIEFRGFKAEPPQTGYEIKSPADIRPIATQGNKIAQHRVITVDNASQTFDLVMQQLHFGNENVIKLDVDLTFWPTPDEISRVDLENATARTAYEEERNIAIRRAYVENVRARIKDASAIKSRPSWDLREEERTVIYRNLLKQLMLGSQTPSDQESHRRLAHVRSEIIRSIFDIDAMLYFVAPEWWMPRNLPAKLELEVDLDALPPPAGQEAVKLTEADTVSFGGSAARRDANYMITEASTPAKLGSSLGWLLQLDGDNHRNAFLNSPWVKAVIPVRPGRETAALNWLRTVESQPEDGWNDLYKGADSDFVGKKLGEVLRIIAERLSEQNRGIDQTLAADKVFEEGFSPLGAAFDAAADPDKPFSQWISIIPTEQIVAVPYEPTSLLDP